MRCLTDFFALQGLRSEVNKHVTEQLSSHIGLCFKYMKERKEGGDNSSQQQADQEGMLVQQQQKEIVMSNEVHHLKHQLWKTKEAPMRHGMALQMIKLKKQAGRFCDGIYTWRIEKFRDCFQDAIGGSCTAKYSPSFYTSLYLGYNLCM
ncbi:TNF receptor-associated factor 2-like [Stylophora pistillata]|uniref:TNF receptor-associated factor 2-like n=1 Tax=Stylophora pistillata TaxID=50429 RepID=UPI000C04A6CE|nr:TNF receptor-associated factor 2-like [Stylophora pistillata]